MAIVFAILLGSLIYCDSISAAGCPAPGFLAAGTFGAGNQPVSVAVADFNGDGRRDLVVANQLSANVSVLLGNNNGTFQSAVNYSAGSGPSSVAVGDFNLDGKLDLAVSDVASTTVWVLLGNGNGTFQTAVDYDALDTSQSVAVGDFNSDGKPDLAVANRALALVSVLLGNGNGTFQAPDSYTVGTDPYSVAVGDFNGDGRPDLAVANAALFDDTGSSVSILLGKNPAGTFQLAVNYSAGTSPRSVAVGDFNSDGRVDLVVAGYGAFNTNSVFTNSSVLVLLGNGNGTFPAPVSYAAGEGPLAVTVTNLNGDARSDLVVANDRSGSVSVLFGNSNGTFQAAASYGAGTNPRSVAAGDFNSDSQPDLTVAIESGALVLLSTCIIADLSISMADAPDPVMFGSNVTYLLTVTNSGPLDVPDATITNRLPPQLSFVSATSSQGSCTISNGVVICALGNFTNGAQATATIIATATAAGTVVNSATILSLARADSIQGNNTATAVTTVLPVVSITATDPIASEPAFNPGAFTVSRAGGTAGPLTVNYSVGGSASSGSDYIALSGSVTISNGSTSVAINVTPIDDFISESNETVVVTLSLAATYIVNALNNAATVTIHDDDSFPLSINNVTVTEGNSGTTDAVFTVNLPAANDQTVTVNFATTDGTATAGSDYVATNGTISFAPGTTNRSLTVKVLGDLFNEANETFFVNLSSATNAVIADGQGLGTINNDDLPPSLSINDVTVAEGTTGTTNAVFTVSLSQVSGQTVTVNFAAANGTATAGSDYVATNGTLTFAPGTTSQTITVRVNGDLVGELDETFFVNLSGAANASVADSQGIGTILNAPPSISISNASVTEGNTGTTNAVFAVSLSFPSAQTVTIDFATADGTAVAGSDYVATNGSVSFAPGTTNQTVTVRVMGDLFNEANETLLVNLTNAANALLADGQGIGTINNDDIQPALSIADAAVSEGSSGTTNATFTISLSAASSQTVTVSFATASGTAVAGSDFVATNGSLSFAPGTTNQTLVVRVNGDLLNETNETFLVNLSNPTNATVADGQGVGTINNDDALPALSINDVTLTEGNSGITNAVFTVSLSAVSGQTVTVNFAASDGTATAGTDYVPTNGTLSFAPGTTNQSVTVRVNGDPINEPTETLVVNLSNPINAVIADGQGLGTINNDDSLPGLSIDDVTVAEGTSGTTNAVFTVSLPQVSGQTVTVNFATSNGTATAGSDCVATNGTLTFAPGATNQTITVRVNGDIVGELDETFFVNLSSATNASIADSQGIGTILNAPPSISISNASVTEGNTGTTNAVFAVSLSFPSAQTVTIDFATANGTAVAGSDYVATNGSVSFAPGATNQTVTVRVLGDLVNETNEAFLLNLSNPANAVIADGQGLGTINNDDSLPGLSINDVTVAEGTSGTANTVFTVSLSQVSGQTITVNFATANGTATAGSDYVATNGTLSFAPGATNQTLTVAVIGDLLSEANETFLINLSGATNATVADGQGVGTINDDDPLPVLSIGDVSVAEGDSGTTNMVFTVSLSTASGRTVMVNFATADGTALAGSDYLVTNGSVSFAAGTTSQAITVKVIGDVLDEPNETLLVNLSGATNATVADGQGVGTINNDDNVPLLAISDLSLLEGDSGTTNAVFTVILAAASTETVTVNFATSNGTANAGADYVATNGLLSFAPGTTNQTLSVRVLGDLLNETNETFLVNLSNPTNATVTDGQGLGTINNDDPLPSLSINDVSVNEGNSGSANAVFTVSLSAASGRTVSVNFATANGTAVAGNDYVATNGSVSFAPGVTSQTVTVQVLGDQVNETNETLLVNLSNATNATVADSQAVGTINNDDALPGLSINDVTLTEGNSGTTNAIFTISLSAASAQTVTVNFATADGTAQASSDYVATNGSVSFVPGTTNQTLTVAVIGDLLGEGNETFLVNLANATNAVITDSQGVGTINNDEALPGLSISNVTLTEGNSGTTNAVFTVSLSPVNGQTVTVNFATSDGTATAGTDYVATNGLLTFAPGITNQTLTVRVNGDLLNEVTETFMVNLSNPTNSTIADGQGLGTINDDDPLPSLSINDVSVSEGNSGSANAVFTVSLSVASGQTVNVNFATADGTAVAGSDYVATNGTLSFAPGVTNQSVTVKVLGDLLNEPNETFLVNLSNPTNATVADTLGVGTINNDDTLPGLSINDLTLTEGNSGTTNAIFTISLSAASAQTVTVNFATANGIATAGSDYVATNGSVSFAPGTTNQTLTVRVLGEVLNEANETFLVNLSSATNATVADGQGLGTINNDDPLPAVSINDVAILEGNGGTANAVFTVGLSAASGQTVTVNFATANGTGLAGADFVTTNGTLTFAAGTTNQSVTVRVNGDLLNEATETFLVNLSNPTNVTIADGQGLGTINDDDPPPSLSINDVTVAEGTSGITNAIFMVSLSPVSGQTVTVNFATANGTAIAGSDYLATNGTLSFAPGVTNQSVTVRVNGDIVGEFNETFLVDLSVATNASVSDDQGVGTIVNAPPTLAINNALVTEGDTGTTNAVFTVSLSFPSAQTVTVDFAAADGTASAGSDYVTTNGTLSFAPGATNQTIAVAVNGDVLNEANETFFINLTNPANAFVTGAPATGTINNDDPLPALSITDVTLTEGNLGTTNAIFTVSLSAVSGQTVTVNFATANGTATAGGDYAATNGLLTFAPGATNQTIIVRVNGDPLNEVNETIFVNLSNPGNATLTDSQGLGTINDDDPPPSLTIANATLSEGNAGTANALFTVSLSAASGQTVTVNFATADGTAAAGSDYVSTNGLLTFAPGTINQTVTVQVNGDLLSESNETFFVNLSSPANATVADGQGVGTINNDDTLPALSINDVTLTEGNSGTTNAVFIVSLSAVSGQTVTVNFAAADSTASAGTDYLATNGVLSFPPGTSNQTLTVRVNGETLNELNETFLLNLSSATNATIADGQGVGTIVNDDPVVSITISNTVVYEGNSGTTNAMFTVSLSAPSGQTVSVGFDTADGTASRMSDYTRIMNGTVTFTPGQTNQIIAVTVNGDTTVESNETFFVNLSGPVNATLAGTQGVGTILNDDGVPSISILDATVVEGNAGMTNAVFSLRLSTTYSQTVTVNVATTDGSALAGSDYLGTNGTVSFSPGVTNQTFIVKVLGDLFNESNETFLVNLSSPTNATIADGQAVGTINNNDPVPGVSIGDVSVTEGDSGVTTALFTVSLSAVGAQTVTVNFATANGTATAGSDYVATNGSVNFAPGTTSQTITVRVLGDVLDEPNETFLVNLSSPVNATLGDSQGVGTINNDDGVPSLAISDASVVEGDAGTTNAVFTITLSAVSDQVVTVIYTTGDGIATAGTDYGSTNGLLSFDPGVTSLTVTVGVNGDLLNEAHETFFVNLSSATNATIVDSQGVGTINNDDPLPALAINDVTIIEGNSGTTNAVFTVSLSAVSGQTVTVNLATSDGTATAGADYVATNGLLSFAAGTTNLTLTVRVNGDLLNEVTEAFLVNLSNPTNATIADGQGLGTINDDDPLPSLSISDVTVSEGNSGSADAVFNVSLSAASGQTVSVNFATADGTAVAGSDYVATNGMVSFAPGVTNQTLTVQVVGDLLNEPNETFLVNLSNPTNVLIADGQGLGTISNEDSLPSLSINDVTVTEGDSGTTNAVFTVSLSAASAQTVTVTFATANGTATAGGDYVATNGSVSFAPGTTNQTLTVAVLGDLLNEANQTFLVNLSSATNATVADSQGVGTINNDDPLPAVTINDVTILEGNSGTTNAVFTVGLSAMSGQTVTVNFATTNGSAIAGSDYVATNGVLSFAPGTTNQSVTVRVNGDLLNEVTETFLVNLSTPTNATIADGQGLGTINDNDPLPDLSINNVTVAEGTSGTTNAVFTVSLSAASGQTVSVNFATADGTAIAGSDYLATNGTVSFAPGVTNQSVTVKVLGDLLNEPNKTFLVNLSNSTNATVADGQGVGTISNDDALPSLSINDVTVTEGDSGTTNAVFTVNLSAGSAQTVTVNFATANGTATAGSDYVATNGSVSFAPGATNQTLTVAVLGDLLDEANQTFLVNLSSATNATVADGQGVGTINNDDPLPAVSINDVAIIEGNSGTANAVFTVGLSAVSGQTVTVNFAAANGTALAGADFVGTNGTLTFSAGTTNQSVTVRVNGDLLNEVTETFLVNLSNPTNAIVTDGQGLGTINDDDPLPNLSINGVTVSEGNSGSANAVFTVNLSVASGQTVSVNFATADGTAAAGSDYVSTNGTVDFAPGVTNQSVTVRVLGDVLNEADEAFFVNLSSATNAVIVDSQGVGTINNDDALPGLSITNVTLTEGNSGTSNAVFTVTLTAASAQTVTVNFATSDGTATAGADYVATNGLLSFAPGTTNRTLTVAVIGDLLNEANETFLVNLFTATNATVVDSQGVGTINNDDNVPSLAISNLSLLEVDSGTTNAVFIVILSAVSAQTVTVNFATSDGTALAGADFVATNGTLTFTAGTTNQTVTVRVNGDLLNEATETFLVNLSNPTNATIADGQGLGTINDDDPLPGLSINDVTVSEGNSGSANAVFMVSLSAASGRTVSVNFAAASGTAVAGSDFVATNGSVSFAPGVTSQTVAVQVLGDLLNETNETFFVNLSTPTNATLSDNQGLGTINNDDPLPALSITDAAVGEGDSGTTNAIFTISLSAASAQTVTVTFATANGTAVAGSDYVATNGSVSFAPGITNLTLTVRVLGDVITEANETFLVNLANATNAVIAESQGVGTINDDDTPPGLSITNVTLTEGNSGTSNAVFTVSLAAVSGQTVTVNFATSDGTATAGADYVATNGSLTFTPGTTNLTLSVRVLGDVLNEADETFVVNLSNATNATVADGQGLGTINNDDSLPALFITDAVVSEGDGGTTDAVFIVNLSAASAQTVTVNFATANGTATAGSDYLATNGSMSFAPGTTIRAITVKALGDVLNEANETFLVNLSSATNATVADSQGVGTINDDDNAPSLAISNLSLLEDDSGTTNAVFTVSLSAVSGQTVTVNFATANGTATAGADYVVTNGLLSFAPGTTNQTLMVAVIGDLLNEPNETFLVNLSNPTNATIADGQGVGTINNDDNVPSLAISNLSLLEGDSGTTNAVFTVSLSAVSGQPVTVNFATSDGTATAGTDYVATNGLLSFAPGATSQTLSVQVLGDLLNEANETFAVSLSNPTNATIVDGQGLGTINDDDPLPGLSINDVTVSEGDSGSANAVFTVSLSAASGQTVSVNFAAANGTAVAGSDYVATNGTLSFAPGTTNLTLSVRVLGDVLNEADETFVVNLSNATNATVADGQGLGTINDDDPLPSLSIDDVAVREGNSGSADALFTVSLSAVSGQTVSVNFAAANGTAVAGSDYVATNGSVSFAPGTTNLTLTVRVLGDVLNEADETFFVNLSGATNAVVADSQGVGTINDDDTLPGLSITNVTLTEGNSGTANAVFTVTLAAVSAQPVTVNFATSDGTATAGTDYVATNGLLSFAPGATSQTLSVQVLGDLLNEANETFAVSLSNPTNATIVDGQGLGTINDNDPLPGLSINDVTVSEGDSGSANAVFTVSLSAASGQTVSVNFAAANGTAVAGSDYVATNGTLSFAPGTTNLTLSVRVLGDVLNEADETFVVNLSNATNATVADGQGLGTINNDDSLPALFITDAVVSEGDGGTTDAVFIVNLSAASAQTVTVNFATANGTATAGSDYLATNGSMSFAPGTTIRAITVKALGDVLNEANETFLVNLSSATNATVADSQGVGTINDDDNAPSLAISNLSLLEDDSGTTNAVFTVSLSAVSGQTVTVNFATANGTATAGADYVVTNGLLSFAPGTTNQTLMVAVIGDLLNEPNETFLVNLSNPTNATIADGQGVGTINNDDNVPSLAISNLSLLEGDSGTTNAVFTVSLSAVSGQPVTVNFATSDGTATAGTDYVATNGLLSFAPGATSQTLSVQVLGDLLNEANETFAVSLSNPTNATIVDGQGLGTINDDDPLPGLSINDVTVSEGDSGSANAVFTVSLSAASGQTVSVNFAAANGTAVAGSDYVATNGTLSFAPGTTNLTLSVRVLGDVLNEADETFVVNLSNATNATVADGQGLGTINNDDSLPALFITDAVVSEGDGGTTDAVFIVNLSAASAQTVTVNFATANGTATAGSDYLATNGSMSFAPGTTIRAITVKALGDVLNEANETFLVNLSSATNATVADSQGVGTINDDDPLPALSINDATVSEGNSGTVDAVFTVSLSAVSGQTVTVNFATADGMSLAGSDYVATNGSISFTSGVTNQTLTVKVLGDLLNETNETFLVNLTGPTSATLAVGQGLGTIINDDPLTRIMVIQPDGDDVHISFTTTANGNYRVERADDLETSPWTIVVDNVPGTGNIVNVTDVGGGGSPSRFYRIRVLP